ncbi:MAG: glycosyltransferase family 4 protein [Flavobacteriaceae bacterium]
MKVIFLALSFPTHSKVKYMYYGLVAELCENGHDVTVVAPVENKEIRGLQIENGIKVLRVTTLPLFGTGIIKKGIANVLLPYQYKKAMQDQGLDHGFDLIITPTPPITLYSVVAWLKKKSSAKAFLILRDIFPQNAVDLGLMNKYGPIHWMFRQQEKKLYKVSDYIGCMSEGNIAYIKEHNPTVELEKLLLLPNWSDLMPLAPEEEVNQLRSKEGLENKFIVIFGGNLGLPQKLENIVALAEACIDMPDVLFIIMGGGTEAQNIKQLIEKRKVSNLKLMAERNLQEYTLWVQMADVGLISLNENFTIPNIPSKVLSYYNSSTPILASVDKNTDFGINLEKEQVGLWAEAGQTEALKAKLMVLYHDAKLRKQMGANGHRYMKEHLSSHKAYSKIMAVMGQTAR